MIGETAQVRRAEIIALVAAVVVLAACCTFPTSAHALSRSDKYGTWKATVTFKRNPGGSRYYKSYRKMRVTLRHGRRVVFKRRAAIATNYAKPVSSYERPKLKLTNLDADPDPEVVLRWYAGCTHSCSAANVFGVGDARSATIPIQLQDGFFVTDLDANGISEFEARDSRFSYKWASYASSGQPIHIVSLASGTPVDVTRQFPSAIEADAAKLLKRWEDGAKYADGGGVALAYAADQCLLGRPVQASEFLSAAQESTTVPRDLELGYDPNYASDAYAFLVSVGYC